MWKWFDGKKAAIGTAFFILAWVGQEVIIDIWNLWPAIMPRVIQTLNWGGMFFGSTGLVHKGVKKTMLGA